jgi:serine/threonine protein phosphatase PrpC
LRLRFRKAARDPRLAVTASLHEPPAFETAARTHVGTVRRLNEDRVLMRDASGLWAVADGMGGHRNGDMAAQTVIDEIAGQDTGGPDFLQVAGQRANRIIWEYGRSSGLGIAGATVAALVIRDGHYECHWAGDSQIWLHRGGSLRKLTRDHSLVEELVGAGVISEAERTGHPQAHVITRAIGVAETVRLDVEKGPIEAGDMFLICSDGLTGALSADEIAHILLSGTTGEIADALLARALAHGASDNVSLILVSLPGAPR